MLTKLEATHCLALIRKDLWDTNITLTTPQLVARVLAMFTLKYDVEDEWVAMEKLIDGTHKETEELRGDIEHYNQTGMLPGEEPIEL